MLSDKALRRVALRACLIQARWKVLHKAQVGVRLVALSDMELV
jgi:hypothetical protein